MPGRLSQMSGFVSIPDGQIYYELDGVGQPVILLHAGVTDCRMFDDAMSRLASQFAVVRYDQRGWGRSSPPTTAYADDDDLATLMHALGLNSAALVGVSGGGAIALDFARLHPEMVDALVVVSSGLGGYQWSETIGQKMRPIGEAIERGDFDTAAELRVRVWTDGPYRTPDQVSPTVRQHIGLLHADAFRRFQKEQDLGLPDPELLQRVLEPPTIDRLEAIKVPTLILVGDRDEPDILKIGQLLGEGIAGANTRIIPEVGHMLIVEQPARIIETIAAFIVDSQAAS